jgi:hypothetical protein
MGNWHGKTRIVWLVQWHDCTLIKRSKNENRRSRTVGPSPLIQIDSRACLKLCRNWHYIARSNASLLQQKGHFIPVVSSAFA